VLVSPAEGALHGPVDDALARIGRQRRVALSVPSFLVLKEVLQTDDLIAFAPERLIDSDAGNLRKIRSPFEVPGFDVIAAWHTRTDRDPALHWLRSQLAGLAQTGERTDA
jgi:DNA-binding transcriptional LysR family regulator